MRPFIHLIIKYFDKKRLSGVLLLVSLFLLISGKELIAGGSDFKVAYYAISDSSDNLTAVGINSYEDNSMISLPKFKL